LDRLETSYLVLTIIPSYFVFPKREVQHVLHRWGDFEQSLLGCLVIPRVTKASLRAFCAWKHGLWVTSTCLFPHRERCVCAERHNHEKLGCSPYFYREWKRGQPSQQRGFEWGALMAV